MCICYGYACLFHIARAYMYTSILQAPLFPVKRKHVMVGTIARKDATNGMAMG